MTDQQKTPLPGEWWETRSGKRVRVCPRYTSYRLTLETEDSGRYYVWDNGQYLHGIESGLDLTRHLPDCTGWDWEELKNG